MIIGLSGLAGVGKDTVADFLVRHHAFEKVALADPMKHFCKEVFGFTVEQLWGPSAARNAIDPRYGKAPREALQTLGTQWGRAFYENVWVDRAIRSAQERLRFYRSDGVVIPDVRFLNEREAIQAAGGQVWRIVRTDASYGLVGAAAAHISETELGDDTDGYNRVLCTTGCSLEMTRALVSGIIRGEQT